VNPTALPREPRLYVLVSTGSTISPAGCPSTPALLWTLNHPAVYRLLAGDRGWTPDRFERWLAGIFCPDRWLAARATLVWWPLG
jgi:hypothetical protein